MPKTYKNRWYMKDIKTGKTLKTTVMWDKGKRVAPTREVIKTLREQFIEKAKELGGRNLKPRDFIDAYKIRGPSFGDVVRQVMREFHVKRKIQMRNVGTKKRPRYVCSLV